jgi:hypothetical protein
VAAIKGASSEASLWQLQFGPLPPDQGSVGLAFTIALVMLAVVALGQPFAGISRVGHQPFDQLEGMF